ncbi:MAG TPA: amidohydrolase [Vicinamibacteria bacterium]|nr:amidohydrolase [Vicinamibacteria bacterium]
MSMLAAATPTKRNVSLCAALLFLAVRSEAGPQELAGDWLTRNEPFLVSVADRLWHMPEPAHHEIRTSAYLQSELARAGFEIRTEIAGLPTAFAADYGRGKPVVGVVALLDALPGTGDEPAWHGCGHHLIGAGDLGAALALREAIASHAARGTLRFYGAPAEEIYHGGVYMVRAGAFDDVDALLFWHPSSVTTVIDRSGLAMDSVRFSFRGLASDATDAPEKGRNGLTSALQLSSAVEKARVDWPAPAVVNHVLLEGGTLPSVVPERAVLWYFLHARDRASVNRIRADVEEIARKIAIRTETELEIQVLSSTRHWLINRELSKILDRNLGDDHIPVSFTDEPVPISDDTAEASWVTPRGGLLVQAFPAETPSHSRAWNDSGRSRLAHEALMLAARTLARTALDLMLDGESLEKVKREFERETAGQPYRSPLPEGRGPFDFLPRPRSGESKEPR